MTIKLPELNVTSYRKLMTTVGFKGFSKASKEDILGVLEAHVSCAGISSIELDDTTRPFVDFGFGSIVAPTHANKQGFVNRAHINILQSKTPELANEATFFNIDRKAKVFVVKTATDLALLHYLAGSPFAGEKVEGTDVFITEELNVSALTEIVDVIVFSQEAVDALSKVNATHNLHGMKAEQMIIVNESVVVDAQTEDYTEVNVPLAAAVEASKKARTAKAKKKDQFEIRKISIDDLVYDRNLGKMVLPADTDMVARTVKMSANRLFRTYHNIATRTDEFTGLELTVRTASDFMVFAAVSSKMRADSPELEIILKRVLADGFVDLTPHPVTGEVSTDTVFQVGWQSASQARSGKFYFTSLDRDAVRAELAYDHDFGKKISMAKVEARLGMGTSSSLLIGGGYSFGVIDDREDVRNREVVEFDGQKLFRIKKDIVLTPTDGQGTIEIYPAATVAHKLGLISERELAYFRKNYKEAGLKLNDLRDHADTKLTGIFRKIPSAFQIRHAGDKGLLVMFEHSKYGYDQDILTCKSMHKYGAARPESDVMLEICGYSKPTSGTVNMNYQFLQALDITKEDITALAGEALTYVTENVMTDATFAMKFLGMVQGIGAEEGEMDDKTLVNKITKILAADPNMIDDKKVQSGLKNLLNKFINEMAIGRIPVEGDYVYIATDPRFLFEDAIDRILQAGQNWYNGRLGLFAGFRAPLNSPSEIARLLMVEVDDFWYLRDVIILNPFDDTLPRMGGADTDGDKILLTMAAIIMKSLPALQPMLHDAGKDGKSVANNWDNRVQHFYNTSKASRVGQITLLCTTYLDLARHEGQPDKYYTQVSASRFWQGWEIDSAKTGFHFELPESVLLKVAPHWMVGVIAYKAMRNDRDFDLMEVDALKEFYAEKKPKNQMYHSNSPMGALYDFVLNWKKAFSVTEQSSDKTFKFARNVDVDLVRQIAPIVKTYEEYYRREVAQAVGFTNNEEFTNGQANSRVEIDEAEMRARLDAIYSKYAALLASLSDDEATIAYCAYNAAYNRAGNVSRSCSFPWNVAFNGMLQLLHMNGNATRLARLPEFDEAITSVVVNNVGMLFINGEAVRMTDFPQGVYEVTALEGSSYIAVPRKKVIQEEVVTPEVFMNKEMFQFSVTGYRHLGLNGLEVLDAIKANNGEVSLVVIEDRTMVMTGERVVGYFNKTSNDLLYLLANTKVTLHDHSDVLYMPKNKTDKTVMHADGCHAIANSFTMTAVLNGRLTEEEYEALLPKPDANNGDIISMDYEDMNFEDMDYYESMTDAPYESDEHLHLFDDAGMMSDFVEEGTAVAIAEETTFVATEQVTEGLSLVTVPETMEESVLSKVNLNQPQWAEVQDIAMPTSIDAYSVTIVNCTNMAPGAIIGVVTAYKNEVSYNYNVSLNENRTALVIDGPRASKEFSDWALRLVSYKAIEKRIAQ